jgi:hypothetical protein
MDWTPARIDELIALWRQGLTTYQMAAHFHVTRNTVCGKLYREKVKRGLLEEKPRPPRERRRTANSDTVQKRIYTRREAMLTLPDRVDSMLRIVSPPSVVPDQGQLASIVDVTGCRWPVKDDPDFIGGFAFCNHAPRDGSAYCEYHARMNVAPWSADAKRRTAATINYILKRVAA